MAGGERPVRLGIKMLTESVYDDVPYGTDDRCSPSTALTGLAESSLLVWSQFGVIIDYESEIGELVPGSVVIQQCRHEQRVERQTRIQIVKATASGL